MVRTKCDRAGAWLERSLEALRCFGYAVVEGALEPGFLAETRAALYRAQGRIHAELGAERLRRAGELGVVRLPMKYDAHFFRFLDLPEVLAVVDRTVSETAVLHLQNGFILPSFAGGETPKVFQNRFHRDFPRVLNGWVASINILCAVDPFTRENGATWVVPGTHQREGSPAPEDLATHAIPAECPAGSLVVFDSTLWHAAGMNVSGKDRLAVNLQFTRSYFKQQIDYVRALGESAILAQSPRARQLLGWFTRVPQSLDEFYRPEEERLYRKGQG